MTAATTLALDQYSDVEAILERCVNDGRFLLENFATIEDEDNRFVPFHFNHPQNLVFEWTHRELSPGVWVRVARDTTFLKGRQFGLTTQLEGLQSHACWFHNWKVATIAFAQGDAYKIRRRVKVMYESVCQALADTLGIDPYEYMPRWTKSTEHEFYDENRGCSQEFFSERTKGSGRSQTRNWIYCTDLSEWATYAEAISGLAGSLAKGGLAIVDRDGTGKGPGNALHSEWERCSQEQQADPDGTTRAFFIGVNEVGYTDAFLAHQRKLITPESRFRREYPHTPKDAFTGDPNARFAPDWIDAAAAREPHYLVDVLTDDEIRQNCIPCHCIDSAEGTPAGDYAVIKTRDAKTGLEIMPPWRKQASPDDTAQEMAARHARFPGVINPLRRNHGAAVISRLKVLGLSPWLYRMTDFGNRDGKEGLDENTLTVPQMQTEYEVMLKGALINLPSENGRMEATIFGLQKNGKIEAPPGFHDDELVADMGCVVAFKSAIRRHDSLLRPPAPFVQTSSRPRELS